MRFPTLRGGTPKDLYAGNYVSGPGVPFPPACECPQSLFQNSWIVERATLFWDYEFLAFCNGGCPKDRFVGTEDGKAGLSYLSPAYRMFFAHAQ